MNKKEKIIISSMIILPIIATMTIWLLLTPVTFWQHFARGFASVITLIILYVIEIYILVLLGLYTDVIENMTD